MLLVSLGTLLATTVLFMLAASVAWLFVARGIQGLATGLALGAARAALLDLHPRRDPAGVGLTNGVVSAGGMGLGVLVSSLLVQFAPAPRVLPYVALFVLFAIAFVGALLMPEPVAERSRPRLTPQRPSIPAVVRRPFLLAALGRDLLVVGRRAVPVARPVALGDAVPDLQPPRDRARRLRAGRLGRGRAAGLRPRGAVGGRGLRLARAVARDGADRALRGVDSAALYWAGAVIGGGGFGVAFLGALRALSAAIPPEHRAAVMSAFYIVAYAAISVPAILAGTLVSRSACSRRSRSSAP